MSNLSIILALQDGTNVEHYTSIFCPRVGEFIRFSSNKEYKVLEVHHSATSGTQFSVYAIVEDINE